jgi:hypothetical protein
MAAQGILADLIWLPPLLVGAALTALPVAIRSYVSWRRRPILEIYQAKDDAETYVEIGLEGESARGYFVAIKVRNKGSRAALGCYAKLVRLERQTSDGAFERVLEFRDPERLPWANRGTRGFEGESVEKDIPQTIGLCHGDEGHPEYVCFNVRTSEIADGRQRHFTEGVYRTRVRVYAENAKLATARFVVAKGASWKDLSVQQVEDE